MSCEPPEAGALWGTGDWLPCGETLTVAAVAAFAAAATAGVAASTPASAFSRSARAFDAGSGSAVECFAGCSLESAVPDFALLFPALLSGAVCGA